MSALRIYCFLLEIRSSNPGADPGFSFKGGASDYVPSRARSPKSLPTGVQGLLKGVVNSSKWF